MNELAVHRPNPAAAFEPTNFEQAYKLFGALIKSQMLPPEIRAPEQALFVFLAGKQIGLNMMQSFTNIYFIRGKIVTGAVVIAAQIQASPLCENFKIIESTDRRAAIEVKRRGRDPELIEFTIDEAHKLNLTNRDQYQKQPANMLYHRCVTKLGRRVFPEIVTGVYTPDEVEDFKPAPVVAAGKVVNAESMDITVESSKPLDLAAVKPIVQSAPVVETPPVEQPKPAPEVIEMNPQPAPVEAAAPIEQPKPSVFKEVAAEVAEAKTEFQVWKEIITEAATRYGRVSIEKIHTSLGLPEGLKAGWTVDKRALSSLAFELLNGRPLPDPFDPFIAIVRTEAEQRGIKP